MRPAQLAPMTWVDGDTPPSPRLRLRSIAVRSREVRVRPTGADVVHWTVFWPWPGDPVEKTTAAGGGLRLDPATRFVTFPIATSDVVDLVPGQPVSFEVAIVNGDGVRTTYAVGSLLKQARPS